MVKKPHFTFKTCFINANDTYRLYIITETMKPVRKSRQFLRAEKKYLNNRRQESMNGVIYNHFVGIIDAHCTCVANQTQLLVRGAGLHGITESKQNSVLLNT
jgi:hypothetical protein